MDDSTLHEALVTLRAARAASVRKFDIAIEALEALVTTASSVEVGDANAKDSSDQPSYREAAIRVLETEGRPLHVDALVNRFQRRGWYTDKDPTDRNFKNAVNGALLRGNKDGGTFFKSVPATYGLRKWQEQIEM